MPHMLRMLSAALVLPSLALTQSTPTTVATDSTTRAVITEWVNAGRYPGLAVGHFARQ